MTELGEFSLFLALGLTGLGFFFGPIGKALGRWIESKAGGTAGSYRELEGRLAELEQAMEHSTSANNGSQRLSELEERLDFAERLLSRPGMAERLPEVPS